MLEKVLVSITDLEDFVRGCAFYGTGGGGDPQKGINFLKNTLKVKKEISWVDATDVPDDAWIISLFYMGSISPPDASLKARLEELNMKQRVENELIKAYRELEAYTKVSPMYVAACEMGGVNTPAPLSAATELGLTIVDGDYGCGRANPEITNSLVGVGGYPVTPVIFCDYAGSVTILKDSPSTKMAERIGKYISSASFGLVGSAGYLLNGRQMKEALYRGTLTRALKLGRKIREAKENKKDPVSALLGFTEGWLLFKGCVKEKYWEDRDGYMYGHYILDGIDEYEGNDFKVWYKNENHITWLNGEPYVTSPDIISAVVMPECEPITNTDIYKGQELYIIGASIGGPYRTREGLSVMGPAHYGFNLDYIPIEDKMKK